MPNASSPRATSRERRGAPGGHDVGFRLDPATSLRRQATILLDEELVAARRAAGSGEVDAIHAIRQHGKRSRALLRLVRPALRKKHFSCANHAWRDIGRSLG